MKRINVDMRLNKIGRLLEKDLKKGMLVRMKKKKMNLRKGKWRI